jgi:hypothetical protein
LNATARRDATFELRRGRPDEAPKRNPRTEPPVGYYGYYGPPVGYYGYYGPGGYYGPPVGYYGYYAAPGYYGYYVRVL